LTNYIRHLSVAKGRLPKTQKPLLSFWSNKKTIMLYLFCL